MKKPIFFREASSALGLVCLFSMIMSCKKLDMANSSVPLSRSVSSASSTFVVGKNVNDLGIFGDGVTDNSIAITNALKQNQALFFPAGDYIVSQAITLNSENSLSGTPTSRFVISQAVPNYVDFAFFKADKISGVTASNLQFLGKQFGIRAIYAFGVLNSSKISLDHITCNASGIMVTDIAGDGDDSKRYTLLNFPVDANDSIEVNNCNGDGAISEGLSHSSGLNIRYANHWKVTHTYLKNYEHGLLWWGGDSNYQVNGAVGNQRKCANGIVDFVHVENVAGGGIWGSMGDNINVTHSYVKLAQDVGIDFEGCVNSSAKQDTAINAVNGALAVFAYCDGISFENNIVQAESPKFNLFLSLVDADVVMKNVTLANNDFQTLSGVSSLNEMVPIDNLIFFNNSLRNCRINFRPSPKNNGAVIINQNRLSFSSAIPADSISSAIIAGHSLKGPQLSIDNNSITSEVFQSPGIYAITANQDAYDNNVSSFIRNNRIDGFQSFYSIIWSSLNAGITSDVNIVSPDGAPISPDMVSIDGGDNPVNLTVNLDGVVISPTVTSSFRNGRSSRPVERTRHVSRLSR